MSLGKLIGIGNTANVFEWEDHKILKLFHQDYPLDAIEKEYKNALVIRDMKFLKPKVYELISYGDRWGIVYDKIEGETLLEWLIKSGDLHKCVSLLSGLHKEILQNETREVQNYKYFLKQHIPYDLSRDKRKEVLARIDRLPDGFTLCHGDFHPGNILVSDGKAYIIDFMNICYGSRIYDIARTVFLIEYTSIPEEMESRDMIIQFRKELTDLYLMQMKVTRDMISDYIDIIRVARNGELGQRE